MYIIKLQRYKTNKKYKGSFRFVVIDKTRTPKSHKQIFAIGRYNCKQNFIVLKIDSLLHWLSLGVLFSNRVSKLLSTCLRL